MPLFSRSGILARLLILHRLRSILGSNYPWLAIVCSFMLLGTVRAMVTPLSDDRGAFPDEVFHFARAVKSGELIAGSMGLPELRYSERDLSDLASQVEDVSQLVSGGQETSQGSAVYLLHGLNQVVLPVSDIGSRLLLGRLFSLGIGIVLSWVVFRTALLVLNNRAVAVAAAAITMLMPSVNNILSTVSTEGPALLAVAFLLFVATRICLRGISLSWVIYLSLGIIACIFTKITAVAVIPIVVVMLLQRLFFRWRALLLAASCLILGIAVGIFSNGFVTAGAANWYRARSPWMVPIYGTPSILALRVPHSLDDSELFGPHPILGDYSIALGSGSVPESRPLSGVVQFLPNKVSARLAGQRVTVGAWVKNLGHLESDNLEDVLPVPVLVNATDSVQQHSLIRSEPEITSEGMWHFVAYETDIPAQVGDIGVVISYDRLGEGSEDMGRLRWDGITLAVGSFSSLREPPSYDDIYATAGEWGGVRFVNLLKNGSGEIEWMIPRTETKRFWLRNGTWSNRVDGQIFSLYDLDRTSPGYLAGLRAIFVTFWGSIMGGDVPGLARWHYGVASGVLVLAGLGWVRRSGRTIMWRRSERPDSAMPISIAVAFALVVITYGLLGIFRMEVSAEWVPTLFYATARFVLPAITPLVLLAVAGISQLSSERNVRVALAVLVASVFLTNTWMLLQVEIPYYQCPFEIRWDCTSL